MPADVLLEAIGRAAPGVVALDDGVRAVTYGALGELLRLERAWLSASGGERYALAADNGVAWALADLALHTGAWASVPLPGAFTDRLKRHALDDAGIDTVLTDDATAIRALLPEWTSDGVAPASGLHRFRRPAAFDRTDLPHGTRKVTYTSGSTAQPKGVCLDGAALEAVAQSVGGATSELPIVRHLCLLPLWTLLENVAGLYAPLLRGATCVLPSCATTGMGYATLDPHKLLATISAQAPDSVILVPELLQVLVEAAERGWRVPRSLRFVAVGGARVSPSLLDRAGAAHLPVYEGYGLSECASVVCLNTPQARRAGTVGRPLPHVSVRVDGTGQVYVAGHVMLGYLGDRSVPPGAELATGDLGSFDDDGFLRLNGRAGNRFITSYGRNVSPEWIESEISQRLGAAPVAVFGEARPYPVALVGASHAAAGDVAIERAIAEANAALPDYARVRRWARAVRPFSFDDGTLSANGRLRRAEIRARHDVLIDALYTEAMAS